MIALIILIILCGIVIVPLILCHCDMNFRKNTFYILWTTKGKTTVSFHDRKISNEIINAEYVGSYQQKPYNKLLRKYWDLF